MIPIAFKLAPDYDDSFPKDVRLTKPPRQPIPVNNVQGLEAKLTEIESKLKWVEKLDVTVDTSNSEEGNYDENFNNSKAENDFKREMTFYDQAVESVSIAFTRLHKLGLPTKRPNDYFAEMAKSDEHMAKVREKLIAKQLTQERREKVRAMREQKKQSKKIQREVITQRKQEKKKMITALKKTVKGKMSAQKLLQEWKDGKKAKRDEEENDEDEMGGGEGRRGGNKMSRGGEERRGGNKMSKGGERRGGMNTGNKKREYKDSKYGYGGKKKGSKYNDAQSFANIPGEGGSRKGGKSFGGNKKGNFGGKSKRPMKNGKRR